MMDLRIRTATQNEAELLGGIIRRAFQDVAQRFGLTPENCPTHPSHHTMEKVQAELRKGVVYYLAEVEGKAIGCGALEKTDQGIFYLERLAVLPDARKQGIGEALVRHMFQLAADEQAKAISIAIVAQHTELQSWYEALGFVLVEKKRFAHLPFDVAFMTYEIGQCQQ
ncbi:MAG: GNAT family N-acetyltransferase [Thermodesulfobacteriota bacterium]